MLCVKPKNFKDPRDGIVDYFACDNMSNKKGKAIQPAEISSLLPLGARALDASILFSLEKQIFSVDYNNISIVEKELIYNALINNCFSKAFFLIDQNRQLVDYFADYLIRFQIIRQDQILSLFSTVLLSCKKQT